MILAPFVIPMRAAKAINTVRADEEMSDKGRTDL